MPAIQRLRDVPTKFLVTKVTSGTSIPVNTIEDETSPYFGYPTSFQIEVIIDTQTHSSPDTREGYIYNAYDVEIGDWFAQPSGKTYLIEEVITIIDSSAAILKIRDENLYVLKLECPHPIQLLKVLYLKIKMKSLNIVDNTNLFFL